MSLKDIYYKLEDSYFGFLDRLEEKGINLYKIVDPLEKKGIPTFLILCLIILGVILLLIFNSTSLGQGATIDELTLNFVDEVNEPIANQEISFMLNNKLYERATDNKGSLKISDLDPDKTYVFDLNDSSFNFESTESSKTINLRTKNTKKYELSRKEESISKTIYFKTSNDELITDLLGVSFTCRDNEDFSLYKEISTGETTIDVPGDCGELITSITSAYYNVENQELDLNEETGEIYLSPVDQKLGDLHLSALDSENGVGLESIDITVLDQQGFQADIGTTNNNGQITFESLPVGYYAVLATDSNGIYSSITQEDYSSGNYEYVQVVENGTTNLDITLNKEIVGFLNLQVKDVDTKEPIENVEVKVSKNSNTIALQNTDSSGKVLFGVKENVPYNITFDHRDYIIKNKNVSPTTTRDQVQNVDLKLLDSSTIQGVFVSVVDKHKNPVEFAKIKVWNTETNTVVKTTTADIRGKATISNLSTDVAYQLEAITGTYTGKTNPFFVEEREPKNINIALNIGEGTFNLNIVDNVGQPVSTTVRIFDVSTNKEIDTKRATTDNQGTTLIRVRADRIIYFVIDNYDSKFITKKYNVKANTTFKLDFKLPMVSNNSNIKFLGLYDNQGKNVTSVSAGQAVKAKFILNVGRNYSTAQAHIRTGKGSKCGSGTHSLEQDSLYIKEINFAGSKLVGSTTYTPCRGESKDLSNITKRNGKWFSAVIENPIVGSYLIEADLVIKDTATGNLPIFFRSQFHEGNTILRYPEDTILGSNLTSSDKQGLYAYAKDGTIYTGVSNFCTNDLCYYLSVLDKSTNITKNIIDKYNAKENNSYSLSFRFNFNKSLPNASLKIKPIGNTINLDKYNITSVGSQPLNGSDFSNIDLGNINVDDHINGTFGLDIIDDQSDSLEISVLSNGEVVFTKKVIFNITPSKKMNVEVVPSVFVPFINNDVLVTVSDEEENVISLADVVVKVNSKTIETGRTGKSGVFAFTLPSLDLSDVVEIIVKKQGFKTNIFKQKISNNLLQTTPEKLNVELDLSKEYSKKVDISLFNKTILPLAIENISTNLDVDYIDLSISSSDILLQPSQSLDLKLNISITEKGLELMSQKVLKGDLLIKVNDSTLDKTWVIKIPLTLRISFGNGVDNLDCLNLEPVIKSLRLDSQESKEFDVTLTNNCNVDNYPITLGSTYAKLNWNGEPIVGDFYIIKDNKEIKLKSNKKVLIQDYINSSSSQDLKIRFDSYKVEKASSNPQIVFLNRRPNINGVDNIQSILNANIIINNYASCLKIPQRPVTTIFCPFSNLSFNNQSMSSMYNNQFGYSPYSYNAPQFSSPMEYQNYIANPANRSTFSGYNYPQQSTWFNSRMGAANYLEPGRMSNNNMQLSSNLQCPQTRMPIENNCAEDIKVKLDTDFGYSTLEDNKFTITKGDRYDVKLQGGAQYGRFKIGVRAKPDTDTTQDYTFVGEIPIEVIQPVSEIPSDCIYINQSEFDFSSSTPKPKKLTIANTCVSQGYYLDSVSLKNLQALDIKLSGGSVKYFSIGNEEGNMHPINKRNNLQTEDGRRVQEWTYLIQRNEEIQNINMEWNTSTIADFITSIRKNNTLFENSISLKPMLSINYTTPRSQLKSVEKMLTLTDNMQWLGAGNEDVSLPGGKETTQEEHSKSETVQEQTSSISESKKHSAEQGISTTSRKRVHLGDSITYDVRQDQKGKVLDIIFNEKIKGSDLAYNPEGYSVCYTFDIYDFHSKLPKIERDSQLEGKGIIYNGDIYSTIEENNEDSSKIDLCFLRKLGFLKNNIIGAKDPARYRDWENTNEIMNFIIDDTDWFQGHAYEDLRIGLHVEFESEEEEKDSNYFTENQKNTAGNDCYDPKGMESNQGLTGSKNYEKYGFNKLLFDWNPKNITDNTFDLGKYYADQDQLRMTISEKLSSENYTNLLSNSIEFIQDPSGKIKEVEAPDINLDCSFIDDVDLSNKTTVEDYYNTINNLLNQDIPNELKRFTILTFNKSKLEDQTFAEEFENFVNSDINYNKYSFSDKNYYQVSVSDYLEVVDSYLGNSPSKDQQNFVNDLLNTIDIYYGVGRNEFIVNIKEFSENNKDILSENSLLSNMYSLKEEDNGSAHELGTYLIKLNNINDQPNKDANIEFNLIDDDKLEKTLDLYNNSKNQKYMKENVFFKYPINAYYYKHKDIPFNNTNPISAWVSKYITYKNYKDIEDFKSIQDGYIFKYISDKDKLEHNPKEHENPDVRMEYADIRPLQLISNYPFVYRIDRAIGNKLKLVEDPQTWLLEYDNKNNSKTFNINQEDDLFSINKIEEKQTKFKNTYFVFNNLNLDLSTQLKISSSITLNPNLEQIITDQQPDATEYRLLDFYKVPSKLNYDPLTINQIKQDIKYGKICFNTNGKDMNFWINPIYPNYFNN